MLKRIASVIGISGALIIMTAGAAVAQTYPPDVTCEVQDPTISPGQSTVVECGGDGTIEPGTSAVFTVSGPGVSTGTLSAVFAAVGTTQVTKTASGSGILSATFTAPQVTETETYTVSVSDTAGTFAATASITVTGATAAEGGGGLPGTGGTVPTALIWVGAGALGIGGVALTAALARRRERSR
ncbi:MULTISPECIES: hypothetical protein [unclassified Microbacterium]|uniref:hypothetical protein n=1 Tax=unclassified Microbacterium TaxID=2609290 RepID=UPI00214BD8E8|nr:MULTISPECIES: hypothetical protein [unclassified Microbacterium]MCR2784794.1 hypothetical protein [Microbacterium sp. zg.B96]MDL5352754.1 hypothetical protein [Microbacterium sp. zg-YB36]WIM16333.1 hypothetical protein QNO11_01495 [Microbacterium sp. zg-B96]